MLPPEQDSHTRKYARERFLRGIKDVTKDKPTQIRDARRTALCALLLPPLVYAIAPMAPVSFAVLAIVPAANLMRQSMHDKGFLQGTAYATQSAADIDPKKSRKAYKNKNNDRRQPLEILTFSGMMIGGGLIAIAAGYIAPPPLPVTPVIQMLVGTLLSAAGSAAHIAGGLYSGRVTGTYAANRVAHEYGYKDYDRVKSHPAPAGPAPDKKITWTASLQRVFNKWTGRPEKKIPVIVVTPPSSSPHAKGDSVPPPPA